MNNCLYSKNQSFTYLNFADVFQTSRLEIEIEIIDRKYIAINYLSYERLTGVDRN